MSAEGSGADQLVYPMVALIHSEVTQRINATSGGR